MADDVVTTQAIGNGFFVRHLGGVWRSDVIGYCMFYGPAISYCKTTDAGVTWSALTRLDSLFVGVEMLHWDMWYDGWSRAPGTDNLYYTWVEHVSGSDDVTLYFQRFEFDTEDISASIATKRVVSNLPNFDPNSKVHVQICVSVSGSLMITAHWGNQQSSSWTSATGHVWLEVGPWNGFPFFTPRQHLAPGNIGPESFVLVEFALDDDYLWQVYDPQSIGWGTAFALDLNITQTDPINFAPDNGARCFRHSDQHMMFVAFADALENGTNTLKFYDIDAAAQTSPIVNIFLNAAGNFYAPKIMVDHQSDDIIVFYLEKTGSAQFRLMRRISTDDGATWSAAVQINTTDQRFEMIGLPLCNVVGLGRVQPFYNLTLATPDDTIYNSNSTGLFCPTLTSGPEIQVLYIFKLIACGGTLLMGDFTVGETVNYQLTIRNEGDATLVLGTLTDAGDITLVSSDDPSGTNVLLGGSTTVTVTLDTSTDGAKTGSITIPSNDADEASCVINFTANVNAIPAAVCNRFRCRMPGPGLRRDQLGFVNQ